MDKVNTKISIIPFKEDNYIESIIFLIGRMLNYKPIAEDGTSYIIKNEDEIQYNNTGFTGYCTKVLNDDVIEILYKNGKIEGLITGVKSVYEVQPVFIFGELVESLNGTIRQGFIEQVIWHGKDVEFKYFINDLKGKKISRQYSASDLKKCL